MSDLILVKVTLMDREWVARALRSVLPMVTDEDVRILRALQLPVTNGFNGYTGPMTPAHAEALAKAIFAARGKGGGHWDAAMTRLAKRFRTEQVEAVKAKTSANWLPAHHGILKSQPPKRCPMCNNPVEPFAIGKAVDWMCVNCDAAVLPEGEA